MLAFQHAILSRNQPGFSRAFRLGKPAAQISARFHRLDRDVGYPPSGSVEVKRKRNTFDEYSGRPVPLLKTEPTSIRPPGSIELFITGCDVRRIHI